MKNLRLVGRGLLLADQLLFSAANFVLTIGLARLYNESEFGAIGIGLSLALSVQGAQKALYIVRVSLLAPHMAKARKGAIIAEHLIVLCAAVTTVCLVTLAGLCAGAGDGFQLVGLTTAVCYLIYFQTDFDRAILLKLGTALIPALLSLSYLIAVAVLYGLAKWEGMGFQGYMAGLIIFCVAKGILVVALIGARPRWRAGRRLLALDWRRYGMPSIIGAAAYAGFTQVPVMVLASLNGPAQVGVLVAMRTLMQPLMVVIRSLDADDKNRFRDRSGGTLKGARRVFWRTMATYAGIGIAALLVLILVSDPLVLLVYKGKYGGHSELIIGWCLFAIFLSLSMPIQSVVYLLHRQRQAMRWNIVSSIIALAIALAVCGPWGAQGAMLATLCGAAFMILSGLWVIGDAVILAIEGPIPGRPVQAFGLRRLKNGAINS